MLLGMSLKFPGRLGRKAYPFIIQYFSQGHFGFAEFYLLKDEEIQLSPFAFHISPAARLFFEIDGKIR